MNSLRNNIAKDGHHFLYAGWQDTLRVDLLVIEFPRLVFASAKFAARARAGCVINTRQGEIYPHSDPDYSY